VADHFEPFRKRLDVEGHARGGATGAEALESVETWTRRYPVSCEGFRDSDERPPRHTFFYPQEEYDPACIDALADLCAGGFGEVEIHLHHRNDTADNLRKKLSAFRDVLRNRHGMLGSDKDGNTRYGFVHGNWCLCNSRPDGDWCGVNGELTVLAETGCYADFTFPSAPSPTQPRMVNALYRASDMPGRPRGHDKGVECRVSSVETDSITPSLHHSNTPVSSSLLLIQGPLALDWRNRKWGVVPRLENGVIGGNDPPTPQRAELWAGQHVHVQGVPRWVFVKVCTHGCLDVNRDTVLGEPMKSLHEHLQSRFNDGVNWRLHYVTAREMYNIVRAAEDGADGDPGQFRDYEVSNPPGTSIP